MHSAINLRILEKRFTQLYSSSYFDPGFKEFLSKTIDVITHVLENLNHYPEPIVLALERHLWRVRKFVRGSRSNDAPYEVQYALKLILNDWIDGHPLVSSAPLDDLTFYLNTEDVWSFIETNLDKYDSLGYKPLVVRIGSPDLYKHRPVFCSPLFHELGHFIDFHYNITQVSLLIEPAGKCPIPNLLQSDFQQLVENHRMEYFADIFASSYCGEALNKTLTVIAGNSPNSLTHPATTSRISVVQDFLGGTPNKIVDLFQASLKLRGLDQLRINFVAPDLADSFDNTLTYRIASKEELFGIFTSAWDYLEDQLENKTAPWIDADSSEYIIEKTINDSTEKSLRNYEIQERWADADPN